MSSKIISLYGMGLSPRNIFSHIEEMYDVEISHNTLSEIIERISSQGQGVAKPSSGIDVHDCMA